MLAVSSVEETRIEVAFTFLWGLPRYVVVGCNGVRVKVAHFNVVFENIVEC